MNARGDQSIEKAGFLRCRELCCFKSQVLERERGVFPECFADADKNKWNTELLALCLAWL